MNKKIIRLTESDLHKIVNESVKKIITESPTETLTTLFRKALHDSEIGFAFSEPGGTTTEIPKTVTRALQLAWDEYCDDINEW